MARLSLRPGRHGADDGGFAWRASLLDTPSRRLRELRPDVFTSGPYGTTSPFGFSNAANTAPLPWGDRLFATWDVGRPVEVDPASLTFLGEVGDRASWGPDALGHPVLPMYPSTAHPVIDPARGCLWTVVTNPITRALSLLRYDGDGTRLGCWPLEDATVPQSMHTIAQTRDWLVLIDCAFRADPKELFGTGERTVTTLTDAAMFLVRKDDLDATPSGQPVRVRRTELSPELNHYYGVWDDGDGIRLVVEHTIDTDLAMAMRADDVDAWGRPVDPALVGMYNHPMHHGVISEVLVDPETGRVQVEGTYQDPEVAYATQLSAIDWSTEGLTSPAVHHMLFTGFRPDAISQRAVDLYADRIGPAGLPGEEIPAALVTLARGGLTAKASHTFALDDYPTSPCFVPRRDGTGSRYAPGQPGGQDGWIVLPVLHDDGFRVELFDAGDIGVGPVAVLGTDATMPFLIHSAWMPAASSADRSIERLRFGDDLDPENVAALDADLAAAVAQVAADLR
jgi:hypothetical protein